MEVRLDDIYRKAVEIGIQYDPRAKACLKAYMKEKKEGMKKMTKQQKQLHRDRIWNPYDDTRIICGDPRMEVRCVFVSIDCETSELLLVDRLNEKRKMEGKSLIDLVLTHHPESYSLEGLTGVMEDLQVAIMKDAGVPENLTAGTLRERMGDVSKSIHSDNLHRVRNAAEHLGIAMMNSHTASDNFAYMLVTDILKKLKPRKVKDVVKALEKIPVFQKAMEEYDKPVDVQTGVLDSWAGKVFVDGFTGGTDGSEEILKYLSGNAHVGTVIAMHKSKKHREEAAKYHMNSIICNHMAADSLGMQPLVDWLRSEKVEVVVGPGFIDAPMAG